MLSPHPRKNASLGPGNRENLLPSFNATRRRISNYPLNKDPVAALSKAHQKVKAMVRRDMVDSYLFIIPPPKPTERSEIAAEESSKIPVSVSIPVYQSPGNPQISGSSSGLHYGALNQTASSLAYTALHQHDYCQSAPPSPISISSSPPQSPSPLSQASYSGHSSPILTSLQVTADSSSYLNNSQPDHVSEMINQDEPDEDDFFIDSREDPERWQAVSSGIQFVSPSAAKDEIPDIHALPLPSLTSPQSAVSSSLSQHPQAQLLTKYDARKAMHNWRGQLHDVAEFGQSGCRHVKSHFMQVARVLEELSIALCDGSELSIDMLFGSGTGGKRSIICSLATLIGQDFGGEFGLTEALINVTRDCAAWKRKQEKRER